MAEQQRMQCGDAALCPGCGKPASTLAPLDGWLFRCRACGRSWGHPKAMTADEAADALSAARAGQPAQGGGA